MDLTYTAVFKSLVENQMMKISKKDKMWTEENIKDLVDLLTMLEVMIIKHSAHNMLFILT